MATMATTHSIHILLSFYHCAKYLVGAWGQTSEILYQSSHEFKNDTNHCILFDDLRHPLQPLSDNTRNEAVIAALTGRTVDL